MTLKEKIVSDIQKLEDKVLLEQLFDFIQKIKKKATNESGQTNWQNMIGSLSESEAQEMKSIIDKEFNHIEGSW